MRGVRRREAVDHPAVSPAPARVNRTLSLASAAVVALGFALQLVSWQAERIRKKDGYPGIDVLRSWGCTEGRALRWPAEATARRRLQLPSKWPRRNREAPSLLVFVDGARLVFMRDVSGDEPSGVAYYERAPGGRLDLIVACPGKVPCGAIEVIAENRGFDACVAHARFVERPGLLLGVALATTLAGILAWLSCRDAPGLLVAGVSASVALSATWFSLRAYRSAQAMPWLLVQCAGLAARPLLALTALAAGLTRTWLDSAETRLARLASPKLSKFIAWAACLSAAALALPAWLPQRAYQGEWGLHLFNVAQQLTSLGEGTWPSPFLHVEPYGAFYPWFAFYGGPLYALTALLGLSLSADGAYKLTYLAAFVMNYAGATWWARLAGIPGAWAHTVGLLSISSSYWLSCAYSKGAWGEFVATSALPLLLAACTAIARSPAASRASRAAIIVGWLVLSGSHTLTLIWGSLFLGTYALLLSLPMWRKGMLAALQRLTTGTILGIGLNGWFLGPLLAYGGFTKVAEYSARGFGTNNPSLNSLTVIFHPGRHLPPDVDVIVFVQVSLYALSWALAVGASSFLRLERCERSAFGSALLGVIFFLSLLTQGRKGWFWSGVAPSFLRAIQYPPRLHVYLSLCVLALVILGLRSLRCSERRRLWLAGYLVAIGAQFGLAAHQVKTAPASWRIDDLMRTASLRAVPRDYRHDYDYRFTTRRDGTGLVPELVPSRSLSLDLATIHADRAEVALPADEQGPFAANISFSPLIRARGDLLLLGRTRDGLAVIGRRTPGTAATRGTIEPAWPWPRTAGLAATAVALVGSLVFLGSRPRLCGR